MVSDEAKLLYIDGEHRPNMETLTENDLLLAENIILTNLLGGGEEAYNIVTDIVDDLEDDVAVTIDLKEDIKNIFFKINSSKIKGIMANLNTIITDLKIVLDNEARYEVKKIKKQYVGLKGGRSDVLDTVFGELVYDDIPTSVEIRMDLNMNKLKFIIDESQKFDIINKRKWVTTPLQLKIKEIMLKDLESIGKVVGVC